MPGAKKKGKTLPWKYKGLLILSGVALVAALTVASIGSAGIIPLALSSGIAAGCAIGGTAGIGLSLYKHGGVILSGVGRGFSGILKGIGKGASWVFKKMTSDSKSKASPAQSEEIGHKPNKPKQTAPEPKQQTKHNNRENPGRTNKQPAKKTHNTKNFAENLNDIETVEDLNNLTIHNPNFETSASKAKGSKTFVDQLKSERNGAGNNKGATRSRRV
jgi:hypothetical protein